MISDKLNTEAICLHSDLATEMAQHKSVNSQFLASFNYIKFSSIDVPQPDDCQQSKHDFSCKADAVVRR